jgi:nucleoid DNA-binding protein
VIPEKGSEISEPFSIYPLKTRKTMMTNTITKQDIRSAFHDQLGTPVAQAKILVDTMFYAVVKLLEREGKLTVSGFGSFKLRHKDAREARNPQTLEPITIEARKTITFKSSPTFRKILNRGSRYLPFSSKLSEEFKRIVTATTVFRYDEEGEIEENLSITAYKAHEYVRVFLETITYALMRGDRIEIRNFGVFSVKYLPTRTKRNPRTGESVTVPPSKNACFKVSPVLVRALTTGDNSKVPYLPMI